MNDYYIAHSGGHKYISKEWKNGHWVYKYNRPKSGQSLRDKREAAGPADPMKLLSLVSPKSYLAIRGKQAVEGFKEQKKEEALKEKEDRLKELEKQLESADKNPNKVYLDVNLKTAPGGAGELNVKKKEDIESEILKLRSEIDKDKKKMYANHSADDGTGWVVIPENSDLTHHGIDGMKWGKRNGPPYPLSEKQHNKVVNAVHKVARIGDGIQERKDRKEDKKLQKKLAKDAQRRLDDNKKAEKRKETVEERKQKAIREGSYQKLYALKDELSYQDLQNAMNKIRLDQELYSKAYPKKPGLMDRMDTIFNGVDKITKWTNKGINAWDTFADIMNASEAVETGKVKSVRKIKKGDKKKND